MKIWEKGCYLRFVEALQGSLLAGNCAVSTMRLEKASVEEPGECCQTAGNCQLTGPRDNGKRNSDSKRNDGDGCKEDADALVARS